MRQSIGTTRQTHGTSAIGYVGMEDCIPDLCSPILSLIGSTGPPTQASRLVSGQHHGQVAGKLGTEFLHAGSLLFVGQRAVRRKRCVRLADGDLIRQEGDTDVAKDGADMHQTSQTAQGSGGGFAEGGGLAGEGHQRRFVVGFGAETQSKAAVSLLLYAGAAKTSPSRSRKS